MRTLSLLLLGLVLTAGLPAFAEDEAAPEPAKLGTPIVDDADLSIHRMEIACNSYVLTCKETKAFIVIDPSFGMEVAVEGHVKNGHTLEAFWITHEHGDHVSGLGRMVAKWKVPIVAHELAKESIAKSAEAWEGWGFPEESLPPAVPDTLVEDGATLTVGKLTFEVRHSPGHSPGSILFLLTGRILFAGDVLFKGSIGRTDFPGCDPDVFGKSLSAKLWDLPNKVVVLPGHGEKTTISAEKKGNWLFQDFVRKARGEEPITRPWMGVGLDQEHVGPGIKLASVAEGSPADAAGLEMGDVILVFDGVPIKSPTDLIGVIRKHEIADTVSLTYERGAFRREGKLTFAPRPPP